jgi:3D (Asp-Asp-Asp) domain-containing protein
MTRTLPFIDFRSALPMAYGFDKRSLRTRGLLLAVSLGLFPGAAVGEANATERSLVVTATAYNSVASQTDAHPSIAAWGDRLKPDMKAVAVSRDLLAMGLTRGTTLRIEGLEGEYVVLDKTSSRHKRRVDIYMGADVAQARQFGIRRLRIYWQDNSATVPYPEHEQH